MKLFYQIIAGTVIAVILGCFLNKQGKETGIALSIAVCSMIFLAALRYFEPVADLIRHLGEMGNLDAGMLKIMMKATGIGLIAEIASLLCADSGNSGMGKAIQMLASAVILWLSIPMITALLNLLQTVLGET